LDRFPEIVLNGFVQLIRNDERKFQRLQFIVNVIKGGRVFSVEPKWKRLIDFSVINWLFIKADPCVVEVKSLNQARWHEVWEFGKA